MNPVTAFGSKLINDLFSTGETNMALSPYSIWKALAMTECATKQNSDACKELGVLLRYECAETRTHGGDLSKWYEAYREDLSVSDKDVTLLESNTIFSKGAVNNDFEAICKTVFDSNTRTLTGMAQINEFVADETRGGIQNILHKNPLGDVVLVNAVYFKAKWTNPFDSSQTIDGTFKPFNGKHQKCRMMVMKRPVIHPLMVERNSLYQMVKLDYGTGKEFSAIIASPTSYESDTNEWSGMSPTDHTTEGHKKAMLDRVVEQLFGTDTSWDEAMSSLKLQQIGSLQMPRFSAAGNIDNLKDFMQRHGVSEVFAPGGLYDLTSTHTEAVGQISHMAKLTVDEEGSVAVAASVVETQRGLSFEISFDSPFIFLVVHNQTNTIMFAARVNDVE
jgi:serpin B